ncbi:enoyl-CoA hydratase/isomerase family protein [uncultured Phenylobacterium sp.]|uniref:enoyl-CoA hydratase/isomerase family protein n=1 Tax=uncultured Phenylobacterium sp. TaxID=349273 RepID=UPI0025E2E920|nr:enoyl-CoA hydratase/isomerase family protein [uncultured Phenylobacterium sp.]
MTTAFEDLTLTFHDDHAVILLNRPERLNAMAYRSWQDMLQALSMVEAEPSVRSVVLRGAGRAFCAGDNLRGMGPTPYPNDRFKQMASHSVFPVVKRMRELEKPIINVAHGVAMGAGLEMFIAGDIRLATADCKLGIPFAKLGLAGLHHSLPRYVGFTKAAEMLFTGEPIDGAEAAASGLLTAVIPDETQIDLYVSKWTRKFTEVSTTSIAVMKRTFYRAFETSPEDWVPRSWLHLNTLDRTDYNARTARWKSAGANAEAKGE